MSMASTTGPIVTGDTVNVPGDMHGQVKYIGAVAGKRGVFAGVQLAAEYAARGKNSGDVDGKSYFKTSIPGSGIFLPLEKAIKRPSVTSGARHKAAAPSPRIGTPTRLSSFNQGGRTPAGMGTGMVKPSFSQSIGPGVGRPGAASPAFKLPTGRRESLPRPTSPLRKVATPGPTARLHTPKPRPSIGMAKSTARNGAIYRASPGSTPQVNGNGNKFSQSLRMSSMTARKPTSSPALGPESRFDEEVETTPTPTPMVPGGRTKDVQQFEEERNQLRKELEDRDKLLDEQARSIAEMEKNLTELQKLMGSIEDSESPRGGGDDEEELPRDVASLRAILRDKNEKIKVLTVEFDQNRADFRSTIDTLEMASTETERVYEKRVEELLEELREHNERNEDVENVAQQLRQLEELVAELEEGLENARRGEAEARGEVEFLRGEVERSRSELRRERERMRTEERLTGEHSSDSTREKIEELQAEVSSKDDEIRGLKALIQNLNNQTAVPPTPASSHKRSDSDVPHYNSALQEQIRELESLLEEKTSTEQELKNEVTQLRKSVHIGKANPPNFSRQHSRNASQRSTGTTGTERTVLGKGRESPIKEDTIDEEHEQPGNEPGHLDESRTSGSSGALWCEICDSHDHDILSCPSVNDIATHTNGNGHDFSHTSDPDEELDAFPDRPAPLVSRRSNGESEASMPTAKAVLVEGTGDQAGMLAGKSSGVIDPEKWCALCERDGHESVDCPIEDSF